MAEATADDHGHAHQAVASATAHSDSHQQHPLRIYLVVWAWLFVLSACSYFVDYIGLQGYLRWTLILIFMMLKAGLIVAIFMHMRWERLAMVYAILVPPVAVAGVRLDHGHRIRIHALHPADFLRRQPLRGCVIFDLQSVAFGPADRFSLMVDIEIEWRRMMLSLP